MQYRLEIDVVPLLVGVVLLGVGDGGGLEVVVMVAYWYMWCPEGCGGWPLASGGDPLVVAVSSWWWC